jgi:hypothetical protein
MYYQVATAPGDPSRPNEDFAGVLGDCAVLLDGSGAPGDMPTGCIHGVPWYVRQLGAQCLAAMTELPGEPLATVLGAAISVVSALHAGTCDLSCPGTPSSVVVLARTGPESLDYLVLGDSALVVAHDGGVNVIADHRMQQVAQAEYRAMLALPTGTPEHQAARMAFVKVQQPLRNQPGGYPVASTDPASADQALTGSFSAASVIRAAMLTDGVTRFAEFGLGTWGDLLGVLSGYGTASLFSRVREAERSDPDGHRWPRAKRHDDVGVIFWESPRQ